MAITSEYRQTARFERRREAILAGAAAHFNASGLSGTTLADVARTVGLTTTSVTYYYRRKEDLAAACIARAIDEIDELVGVSEQVSASLDARLRTFVLGYFELQAQAVSGLRAPIVTFWDVRALTGQAATQANDAIAHVFRRMRQWFVDDPIVALPRAAQNARTFLIFSTMLYAKEWLARFDVEDYARCASECAEFLIEGLAREQAWPTIAGARDAPIVESGRDMFLRAATELINEHGYRGASVERISARLGVTKGSFYHHIGAKDDLVAQCFERSFEVIRAAHRAAPRGIDDGWTRLCAIASSLMQYQRSPHGPLLRNTALSALPEAMRPGLIGALGRVANRMAGVIVDGIADRSIRPVDPAVAAQVMCGIVNAGGELHHWVRDVTAAEAVDLFVRPALLGVLCTP